jgi:hypothetical protein
MREIRYFESNYAEAPARLVAARPLTIKTRAGLLWVTLDERRGDHWLKPGETLPLATGESAWVSAGSDRASAARIVARAVGQYWTSRRVLRRFGENSIDLNSEDGHMIRARGTAECFWAFSFKGLFRRQTKLGIVRFVAQLQQQVEIGCLPPGMRGRLRRNQHSVLATRTAPDDPLVPSSTVANS